MKYRYIWSEKRCLLNVEAHIRQYIEQRHIFGCQHKHTFLYALNYIAEELHRDVDNYEWIKIGRNFLRRNFFVNLLREGERLRINYKLFLSRIHSVDLTRVTDKKLINLFLQSCSFHSQFRAYFKSTRAEFLACAENRLKQLLLLKFKNNDIQTVFELITTPSRFDDINKEQLNWFELLSNERKIFPKHVIKHIYKHPWLVAHSYDRQEVLKMFWKKFCVDKSELCNLKKEVADLLIKKKILFKKQTQLLKKLKNQEIRYLSWLFQEAARERMRLKGGWAGADFLYLGLYKEISRRTGIMLNDLYTCYRIDEVIAAIQNQQLVVDESEKANRKLAYVFLLKKGRLLFFSGIEAKQLIDREVKCLGANLTDNYLKGQVASLGKVRGSARIVIAGDINMLRESMKNFSEGEIMVTTMTQPNMVPIMKKAVAIVTDEGGLISHAAIIAREFKIPCVVGTEFSTKVLKDGDLIEVDANNGVVRKI